MQQIIEPELAWIDGCFQREQRLAINGDGTIGAIGDLNNEPTLRLPRKALLPGFVNAHSHAFQRGLRGLGETFPQGAGNFWSWREAMYDLVGRFDEQSLYETSKQAFDEMRSAGITTVGEFHYIHHESVDKRWAFDDIVLRAAADAGIRIVLLQAYYKTGGISQPLTGGQKRFGCNDLTEYWTQFDQLSERIDPDIQSLGVVAHSIRAAPIDEIVELHREAQQRGLVFHMHVEEQPAEIEQSVQHFDKHPMAVLTERLNIDERFTAVHCTHTDRAHMQQFGQAAGNVCICPLTEANLGDGIADVPTMLENGACICLGTDSNARTSFIEEMRLLEYGQRLKHMSRGMCVDATGHNARTLLDCATINGALSLGINAGAIETGRHADFAIVDLDAPSLRGWSDDTLLDALVFGTGNEAVVDTCVGGVWMLPTR